MSGWRRSGDSMPLFAVLAGTLAAIWVNPLGWVQRAGMGHGVVGPEIPATPAPLPEPVVEIVDPLAEAPEPVEEPLGAAFHVSSLAGGFAVRGAYEGWARLGPAGLVVTIDRATIEPRPDLEGANTLVGVRVGLARESGTRWAPFGADALYGMDRRLAAGERFDLSRFELLVPGVGPEDLEGSWLLITHELSVRSERYSGPATTYAHGERGFLGSLGNAELR